MLRRTFLKGLLALPFAAHFLGREQPVRVQIQRIEPVEFKPDPNAREAYATDLATWYAEHTEQKLMEMLSKW